MVIVLSQKSILKKNYLVEKTIKMKSQEFINMEKKPQKPYLTDYNSLIVQDLLQSHYHMRLCFPMRRYR